METENRTSQEESFSTQLSNKKTAKQLSELAGVFNFYFFSPRDSGQPTLPQPMIRIAPLRKEMLIDHQKTQNSLDIPYEVIINEHWIHRPQWETAEILAHQLIHIYQETILNTKVSEYSYHNREFIEISEYLGLYIRQRGGYHEKPAAGQFAELMARLGIEKPEYTIDNLTMYPGNRIRH